LHNDFILLYTENLINLNSFWTVILSLTETI